MDLQSFRKPGEKTYTQRSRLFVGNLPTGVTKQEVEKLFSKYGKPSEFSICFINKDRGFGFIRLETRTLAKIAKAELDDTPFRGRQLRVRFATHGAALTVKNLPQFMSNELLEEAFSIFSQIERAILIVDDRRRPTGKGIVEDTGKPAARKALDRCSNGAFLLTAEREQPPRFAQPGTFEYEYDVRWKALMELGNQQNEQVEGNIKEAQEKLGPEMEAARHEHQVMLMRQDLLRRQEGLRRMEELYNQELQKRKQMELHEEQERRRREEELRMHTEEMLHRQQEGFKGSFPENREQEMRMHMVDQAMGLNRNPMAGNPVSAPLENMPAEASPLMIARCMNGQEAPQAVWKLMEERASEDSSAPEDCDTDEELYHFEDRLDPAVDDLSDSPSPKQRRMSPASWNSKEHADVSPPALMFKPTRPPGVQLCSADRHTPLDLFKIFFSKDAVKTLCRNTNRRAAMHVAAGKKYKWTDVSVKEFYQYIGLVFYMAMVKLDHVRDYWRQNTIFSQILPSKVMSRDRYLAISWNVHMSDPDEDPANDQRRGTPQHDRLFRLKPLMTTIQDACKAYYQPRRSLAVDERMVATKAKTGMTQYMKAKPTKWGFKLFVLADSSNGYTLDFSVYTGKNDFRSGQGLSYDIVMSLLNRHYLGCGYHVYMDNFYTSPKLLTDLFSQSVGACGTYRDHTKGCPRPTSNAMSKKSARGTIRWIRDGPTVFVKWMDTREVSVCSTIHSAYKGDEVRRRVKSKDGTWTTKIFPCPSPVVEYNSHMGGVDLSDQLIQYYSVQHKSMKWYRKLFLHFLDIAATNAYILHKELLALVQQKPMSHKDFMEELIMQLCGSAKKCSKQSHSEHVPVPVNPVNPDAGKVASYGRRTCMLCRVEGKRQNTPWKCQACDVPLCLQLTRNCFEKWHKKQ